MTVYRLSFLIVLVQVFILFKIILLNFLVGSLSNFVKLFVTIKTPLLI